MTTIPNPQQAQDTQQATAAPATTATESTVPEALVPDAVAPEAVPPETTVPDADAAGPDAAAAGDVGLAGDAINLLSEHKGKLAIGVAATLGLMVYYGWREKRLAKTDPEEYARLQRVKEIMRQSEERARPRTKKAAAPGANAGAAASASATPGSGSDTQTGQDATPGAGMPDAT